jgi:pSer/pThr/pTyr-binding forkhead associated (FHA) protein/CheY-like chemotaxis protein
MLRSLFRAARRRPNSVHFSIRPERAMTEEQNDSDQTVALPSGARLATSGFHYTPVLMTLFGETKPTRIVLESEEVVIGRSSKADYSINDEAASRQHAKIVYTNLGKPEQRPLVNLVDLKSRNGVIVNGQRVADKILLPDNARIVIGEVQMGFYLLSFPKKALTSEQDGEGESSSDAAAAGSDPKIVSAGSTPGIPRASAAGPKSKLAIIDSDFGFASDLRGTLEGTGRYGVVVYRNLESAIRGFDTNAPQLLLLDADFSPGDSVLEMCNTLKSHEKWGGVPIILLFGVMDHDRIRAGLKAGAQSYLIKPISNLSLLTNRIDIHMNINRMISTIKPAAKR